MKQGYATGLVSGLLEALEDPAFLAALDGAIVGCNRACAEYFETPAEGLIGRRLWDLPSSPEEAESIKAGFAEMAGGGSPARISGRWAPWRSVAMNWSFSPVFESGGAVSHVFVLGGPSPVTEQPPSLTRERAALLQSIIATSPEGVVVIDKHGIIRDFSPSAERMFGYAAREVIGENVSILMPAPYRQEHDGYLARYFATGEKRIIGMVRELDAQRKDGSVFPIELMVDEVFVNDTRLFTGFIRDVSLRKATEDELSRLNAELLHAGRVAILGEMASAIAHEINQPLTAISNYIAACRRILERPDAHPELVQEIAAKAELQIERTREIIRHFRTLLRRGEDQRQGADINAIVQDALTLALVGAHEDGIRTETRLTPSLPPALVDRVQIQQVVLNLVRNAIDALMEVERRRLTITTHWDGGEGVIVAGVHDTGPGLAPEIQQKLFEPFMTTKVDGMGIGLSLCRTIISSHDGRLWVETNDDGGASFLFALPPHTEGPNARPERKQ